MKVIFRGWPKTVLRVSLMGVAGLLSNLMYFQLVYLVYRKNNLNSCVTDENDIALFNP